MAEKNMDADINVEFEESASRQQLNSGESVVTLFGKIKKFFTDLKAVAFSGSYNDLSDTPAEYDLPTAAKGTLGGVTTSSTVTSSSGYTACPIISGIVYYRHPSQSNTTSNADYRLLLSYHADDTGYANISTIRKSGKFLANPSTGTLTATTFKGKLDGDAATVNGHSVNTDVPENAVFTDTVTAGENLLINPGFRVNQRGVSGTIFSSSIPGKYIPTYFVDRWSVDSGSVTINSDGTLTLNGSMSQVLENAVGENVVASVSAGTATYDDSTKTFSITASGDIISWAKLEYGKTATPFIAPNITEEQLKCQRYYLGLNKYVRYPMTRRTSSDIDFLIPINAMLRVANPTLSGTPVVHNAENATAQSGFTFSVVAVGINAISIRATKSNHGLTSAYLDMSNGFSLDAEI